MKNRPSGVWQTPTYRSWNCMIQRCKSPKNKDFAIYGGRGIKVCPRWQIFINFLSDMGERPQDTTIDRLDNNGDYEPGNCRWATISEQNRSKRSNLLISHCGKTQCAEVWARELGIKPSTLRKRIRDRGWSPERALNTRDGRVR